MAFIAYLFRLFNDTFPSHIDTSHVHAEIEIIHAKKLHLG